MAVLDVLKMGHPILRQQAYEIKLQDLSAQDQQELAETITDMTDTMQEVGGTGIAAPQVGILRQLVIYFAKSERGVLPLTDDIPTTAIFNPIIRPLNDETFYDWEGCLSVPGLKGLVPRYRHIEITYQRLDGTTNKEKVSGFHARLLQHECDHLEGILYPQRMDDLSLLMYADQLEHGLPEKARQILVDQDMRYRTEAF